MLKLAFFVTDRQCVLHGTCTLIVINRCQTRFNRHARLEWDYARLWHCRHGGETAVQSRWQNNEQIKCAEI